MTYARGIPRLIRRSLFVAATALAVSGCSRPYELRTYAIPDLQEDWGSVFVNLQPRGRWNEGGVDIEGAPYSITFAPRLRQRPSAECQLHVSRFSITPASKTKAIFEMARLSLTSGPAIPTDPNWQAHSRFFHFAALEKVYLTSGAIHGLKLPYEPQRVVFYLQGSPSCPAAFRTPVRYDVLIETHPYRGKSGPLPSV